MQITKIELAGSRMPERNGMPRGFAILRREDGADWISVELITRDRYECPQCGEADHDKLIWQNDQTVICQGCGREYQPGVRHFMVRADGEDDQWKTAKIVQEALDGHRGTNADVQDYFGVFLQIAD